jgi:RHS repeat-associated protein
MLTEFLYSGEQFDSKIGQQYLRQRYYDPATGRFNRLDPFFGNLDAPQSLHKYLYTHANPVNGIDPTGMFGLGGAMLGASLAGHLASVKSSVDFMVFEAVVATIDGVQAGMTASEILSKYMVDQIEGILFGFVVVKVGTIVSNIFENGITVLSAVRRNGNTSQRPIVLISNRKVASAALEQDIKVLGKPAPPAIRVDNIRIDAHFKDIRPFL